LLRTLTPLTFSDGGAACPAPRNRKVGGERVNRRGSKKVKRKKKSPLDDLKVEVAEELGLMDKVHEMGWAELTAAESGRIGGIMTRRLRELGPVPKPPSGDTSGG
jgi:hypothetical protein